MNHVCLIMQMTLIVHLRRCWKSLVQQKHTVQVCGQTKHFYQKILTAQDINKVISLYALAGENVPKVAFCPVRAQVVTTSGVSALGSTINPVTCPKSGKLTG